MSKKTKEEIPFTCGLVIYTDGGCRDLYLTSNLAPQPIAGYGVHGYTYNINLETPKVQKKTDIPTINGYLTADEVAAGIQAVSPHMYLDAWGRIYGAQTNNIGELKASLEGLKLAETYDAKRISILTDSDYVRIGLTQHTDKWIKNGWKTSKGDPVKNMELWKELLDQYNKMVTAGVEVSWFRVDGHSDNLGNDVADWNATKGIVLGRHHTQMINPNPLDVPTQVVTESLPTGYWNSKGDYNRMISHPVAYMETMIEAPMTPDGRHVYYLGTYGKLKETDQDGKRAANHAFSVVYLKESDRVIEMFRNQHNYLSRIRTGQSDIVRLFLNKAFSSKVYDDLSSNGLISTYCAASHSQDLAYADDEYLTSVARPRLLAYKSIEYLQMLRSWLDSILSGDTSFVLTDITDQIYSVEMVKNKEVVKVTSNVTTPSKAITVPVNYNVTGTVETTPLILTQVLDLPDRNTLAALASRKPTVHIVTMRESNVAFRWAVVIQGDGEVGIWSSVHSNLKLLMRPSKK